MPIYEYECESCTHKLEALQKFSDEPLKKCPECHQDRLRKIVSNTSFQLKGSGWYVTDIRDKGKAPAKEKDAPAAEETKASKEDVKIAPDKAADNNKGTE